jgi:DNA-binding beta-propeller fold protein YncE
MNGRSGDATAIDAAAGKAVGRIELGGKPEFAVVDGAGKLFVNLEDKSEVLVLDPKDLKVTTRWPLAPGEEPSGLAIDVKNRRLFSACGNKMMVILDADTGKVLATPAIGEHVDGAAFDPATGLAFSSNGDGTLTVVHEENPSTFTVAQNVVTQRGARTIALDPKTHNVFLPTAEFGPTSAPTKDSPRPRPSIVPGTFRVLVVGK